LLFVCSVEALPWERTAAEVQQHITK
jgi:hypothetical protein